MRRIPIFYSRQAPPADGCGGDEKAPWFMDACSELETSVVPCGPAGLKVIGPASADGASDALSGSAIHSAGGLVAACVWVVAQRPSWVACSPCGSILAPSAPGARTVDSINAPLAAARAMIQSGRARSVGVLNTDAESGVATEQALRGIRERGQIKHWFPVEGTQGGLEEPFPEGSLTTMVKSRFGGCDLLIYAAGMSRGVLGSEGAGVTLKQLAQRDRRVFWTAHAYRIPMVWTFGDEWRDGELCHVTPTVAAHVETMRQCIDIYVRDGDARLPPSWVPSAMTRPPSRG